MSDLIDAQGFRANVGIVLIRDAGDVFLGGRSDGRGWQFPQGGVRQDESAEQALYRELREEVGLEAVDVEVLAATRAPKRPSASSKSRIDSFCLASRKRASMFLGVSPTNRDTSSAQLTTFSGLPTS